MESIRTTSGEQWVANTEEPKMTVADYGPAVYEPRKMTGEPNFAQEEWPLFATGDPALWLK